VALFEARTGALTARGHALEYRVSRKGQVVHRIGYDLLREIRSLLTEGQPASRASIPTLDLHLARLRHALIEHKVPFAEILPRPAGYDFICCLTHDVDFFGIRRHRLDRTLAGFAARASIGSLLDLVRGRRQWREAVRNWLTLCSLPLVHLRLIRDPWRPFEDYARVEDGRRSTFFLVPFRGRSGVAAPDGPPDRRRAVPYGIGDVAEEARWALARGSELGVHGIDAWHDAETGRTELEQLCSVTGAKTAGIRMHWLYDSPDSPRQLERAGFAYDSTWGYNGAVGYRAGTSQVFRLAGSDALLELPLSIMDSALFSSARMGLARDEAWPRCRQLVDNARRLGGTLVINWHERSLAPERLWGRFYRELVQEVERQGAWFARAGDAVEWFRWRRSIRFTPGPSREATNLHVWAPSSTNPGAVVRVYHPGRRDGEFEDVVFDGGQPIEIEI
jgi:hypothetical protein